MSLSSAIKIIPKAEWVCDAEITNKTGNLSYEVNYSQCYGFYGRIGKYEGPGKIRYYKESRRLNSELKREFQFPSQQKIGDTVRVQLSGARGMEDLVKVLSENQSLNKKSNAVLKTVRQEYIEYTQRQKIHAVLIGGLISLLPITGIFLVWKKSDSRWGYVGIFLIVIFSLIVFFFLLGRMISPTPY